MFPISKKNLRIIGYCGAFVVLGASMASLGPTLPNFAENLQVNFFRRAHLGICWVHCSLAGYLTASQVTG